MGDRQDLVMPLITHTIINQLQALIVLAVPAFLCETFGFTAPVLLHLYVFYCLSLYISVHLAVST